MRVDGEHEGWQAWGLASRIAGSAVSVPVVLGFVVLGVAVVVARSLRDVARDAWGRMPWRGQLPENRTHSRSNAA
jgi:hypothetical protein